MSDHQLPPDVPSLAGIVVGEKYRVERLIGTGGMGTVWRGVHVTLGTPVAIKFIRPTYARHKDARARFEIEARAAAKLRTRHAVQVFDYGTTSAKDGALPYIVMELLEGESLSDLVIRKGALGPRETARIIRQAARALDKAHEAGIVHRDLKPDNIFLATNAEEPDGEFPYMVKLVDFGIAKIFEESISSGKEAAPMGGPTQAGAVIGTPNFMSPEQLTVGGAPGALTDLWSLGACAFAAMTARIPFEGDVLGDIVLKVCAAPMPVPSQLNPRVPPTFDAWFAKACAREPSRRYQSAKEAADALESAFGLHLKIPTPDSHEVQFALKPASPEALAELEALEEPRSMSPRTAMLAGLVLGITAMVGALGVIAWRDRQEITIPPVVIPSSTPSTIAPPAADASTDAR